MTEREAAGHDAPASKPPGENGSTSSPTPTTRGSEARQTASDEKAREKKREQARRARKKRTEAERKRIEEQEERERWEQANTLRLTQVSSRAYAVIISGVAVVLAAVGVVNAALGDTIGWQDRERILIATAFVSTAFLFFVIALAIPSIRKTRRILRLREQAARQKAKEATDELSDATQLSDLLRANRKQMEAYDELARVQARESFRNAQIAIAVGLFVLVTGAFVVLLANTTASKVTVATLTALGGLLSGYITKTFLRVYERAQQQLTFFFQQPLINSYILAADRLIERMDHDHKDTEFSRVVGHVMEVLVQLPQSWGDWTREDGRKLRRAMDASGSEPAEPAAAAK